RRHAAIPLPARPTSPRRSWRLHAPGEAHRRPGMGMGLRPPFHLGRSLVRRLGPAGLIAIVLAAPTITTAWSGNARIVTLAAALSGIAGGIIAAFGIQRSL